jgi:hypothetical protein
MTYMHDDRTQILHLKKSCTYFLCAVFLILRKLPQWARSRDSSVGIASDYGLDDRVFGVLIPVG